MEAALFLATMIGVGLVMRWSYLADPARKRRSTRAPSPSEPWRR